MGWGDEIIATGQAKAAHALDGRRVQILDRHGKPRWHEAWERNPKIARPDERGDFHGVVNSYGCRPYHTAVTRERYSFRLDFRPVPGELHFTPQERDYAAAQRRPQVVISADLKQGASPNKHWGRKRWRAFVELARRRYDLVQLEGPGHPRIEFVRRIDTRTMRVACAVLATAAAYVGHEGGLHHAAAALGVPGVVIFGGFTPVELTGYPTHRNLGVSLGDACGLRTPCEHCARAMKAITPERVLAELDEVLTVKHAAEQMAIA